MHRSSIQHILILVSLCGGAADQVVAPVAGIGATMSTPLMAPCVPTMMRVTSGSTQESSMEFTFRYDSVVRNPLVNTDERKATDSKAPSPSQVGTLRFANEAYSGEMCINFGNVVGGGLGLPGGVGGAVPDFAKVGRGTN